MCVLGINVHKQLLLELFGINNMPFYSGRFHTIFYSVEFTDCRLKAEVLLHK